MNAYYLAFRLFRIKPFHNDRPYLKENEYIFHVKSGKIDSAHTICWYPKYEYIQQFRILGDGELTELYALFG